MMSDRIARPVGEALDVGPALVSYLPDMPRFHLWQGRSRRRYLASVYEVDCVELAENSVVLLVAGDGERREARAVLSFGALDPGAIPRLRAATQASGATEIHVHLLAETEAARAAAVRDLSPARGAGQFRRT
jgi:hypothetical protein